MAAEKIHRRKAVKAFYGNPPNSTFYEHIKRKLIPEPDIELGPSMPGWTDGLITRHQETLRRVAAQGRERRSTTARRVRRSPRRMRTVNPRPPRRHHPQIKKTTALARCNQVR